MALNDADRNHTTGDRSDPRMSTGYAPYIMATVALMAVIFLFLGDTFSARTTLPPEITTPQTTTPVPTPAPANK